MQPELAPVLDGKYRIVRPIGTGSMGAVYLGENTSIGRRVAIKVMHADLAEHGALADRFEREARAAARIRSPHIVEVLDLGRSPDGLQYIVMEHLEGETLEERLARCGPLPARGAVSMALQILTGLAAIHEAGIVHRDLKPGNVFVATDGDGNEVIKIFDFGISKLRGDATEATLAGALLGTPDYMSPEQARGRASDARTDLYAVAVMLYEALSGRVPFVGENVNALLFKVALEEAPPLASYVPDVDPALAAIVHRGMARDPDARFPTARAFHEALAAWAAPLRPSASDVALATTNHPLPLRTLRRRALRDRLAAPLAACVVAGAITSFAVGRDGMSTSLARANVVAAPHAKGRTPTLDQLVPAPATASAPSAATATVAAASAAQGAKGRAALTRRAAKDAKDAKEPTIEMVPQGYRIDPYDILPY